MNLKICEDVPFTSIGKINEIKKVLFDIITKAAACLESNQTLKLNCSLKFMSVKLIELELTFKWRN